MKLHANARLSVKGRALLIERILVAGWSLTAAAEAAGVSDRTARKWLARWRAEGPAGLLDRSSAPRSVPNRTDERTVQLLAALRKLRFTAPELADLLDMPVSTVSAVLKRIGMGKLGRLGLEPAIRYERERPGELIHIDVKKLGRITRGAGKRVTGGTSTYSGSFTDAAGNRRGRAGWDAVHVAVDDATRLAYAEVLPDEKATTAIGFLTRAVAFYNRHGIQVERVITDNGAPYKSAVHAVACNVLGIRHLRTRPYRPQTNGKAERFIRTLLGGWAYGAIYSTSTERTAALDGWLWTYNHHRRHSAIGRQPPINRLYRCLTGALGLGEARLVGEHHGLDAVAQAQLHQHARDVGLDRRLGHDQLGGDLRVGEPARDQAEDLLLALGQLVVAARAAPGPAGRRRRTSGSAAW